VVLNFWGFHDKRASRLYQGFLDGRKVEERWSKRQKEKMHRNQPIARAKIEIKWRNVMEIGKLFVLLCVHSYAQVYDLIRTCSSCMRGTFTEA